jgi:sulfur transfer complex TusBCD TusB component (DsrH family)
MVPALQPSGALLMLHLIGFPPSDTGLIELMQACLSPSDALVLLDEGLRWLDQDDVLDAWAGVRLYALTATAPLPFTAINHDELVQLTEQHAAINSWYCRNQD